MVQKKDTFQDPLGKWRDDYSSIKQSAVDPLLRAQGEVNRIQAALNNPGLSRQERTLLARMLSDAKKGLAQAKKDSSQTMKEVLETKRIQRDIAIKLSTLRTFLANNPALNSDAAKRTKEMEKTLEQILASTSVVKTGIEDAGGVFDKLEQIGNSVKDLPDELRDQFAARDEMLQTILARQVRAQEFLNSNETI